MLESDATTAKFSVTAFGVFFGNALRVKKKKERKNTSHGY